MKLNLLRDSFPKGFSLLFGADLISRSVYQAGKSLILPLFAIELGAPAALLGLIVSISTTTGILGKPIFGLISDRIGRRRLLITAALLFIGIPFLYLAVTRSTHLLIIRPVHGLATAILGPVSLAWLVGESSKNRTRTISWFGIARSGGYLLGPLLGGLLLFYLAPRWSFAALGLLSMPVLLFVLNLPNDNPQKTHGLIGIRNLFKGIWQSAGRGLHSPAITLTSLQEGLLHVGTYATKTFLPIFGLANGFSIGEIGIAMSVKVAVTIIMQPSLGQIGDYLQRRWVVTLGMAGLALTMPLFPLISTAWTLFGLAAIQGFCEAIITPSTIVLIADLAPEKDRGVILGFYGSIRNTGKVVGPVIAGLLIDQYSYLKGYSILSVSILLITFMFLFVVSKTEPKPRPGSQQVFP